VSGYDAIGWILGAKTKLGKLICNSSNDIMSGNVGSEKVDQDEVFYYKDILHFFFFRMTKILHIQNTCMLMVSGLNELVQVRPGLNIST
jgi:hypothetical protein